MPPIVDIGYEKSIELLKRASTKSGFVASPAFGHYDAVWTRDAAITALGALASDDARIIDTALATFDTIGHARTPLGQVAAVVRPTNHTWNWGEGGAVDATAWYAILAGAIVEKTQDLDLVATHWSRLSDSLEWLRRQDVTGTGLISCAPATDWMDSSLTRSGRTLNLNVLYYWAAKAMAKLAAALNRELVIDPKDLRWRINALFWPSKSQGPEALYAGSGVDSLPETFPHQATRRAHSRAAEIDRQHYVSHIVHSLYNEHCDVLANLTAVCVGLADPRMSGLILNHLRDEKADEPFPTRSWVHPISDSDSFMRIREAEDNIDERWRNEPFAYHNGGAWPFIGGFHVAALAGSGQQDEASELLERLAAANRFSGDSRDWGFHEWFHGQSGSPNGASEQAWNAGAFLLAWHATYSPELVAGFF